MVLGNNPDKVTFSLNTHFKNSEISLQGLGYQDKNLQLERLPYLNLGFGKHPWLAPTLSPQFNAIQTPRKIDYVGPDKVITIPTPIRSDYFVELIGANNYVEVQYSFRRVVKSETVFGSADYPSSDRGRLVLSNINHAFGRYQDPSLSFKLRQNIPVFNHYLPYTTREPFMRFGRYLNNGDWGTLKQITFDAFEGS